MNSLEAHILDTIYGTSRRLFERIEDKYTDSHISTKLMKIFNYLSDDKFTMEKDLYKNAKKILEIDCSNVDIDLNTLKYIEFDKYTCIKSLNGLLKTEMLCINNLYIEPFVHFIKKYDYKYLYQLPLYSLDSIDIIDNIFAETLSKFDLISTRINIHNEMFYEIESEISTDKKILFFSSHIGLSTYIRTINYNTTFNPLNQLYILSTDLLGTDNVVNDVKIMSKFPICSVLLDEFLCSKNLIYRKNIPYHLLHFDYSTILFKDIKFIEPFFSVKQIVNEFNSIENSKILFGQSMIDYLEKDALDYWIKKRRLPSNTVWRNVNNIAKQNIPNVVDLFISLKKSKELHHYVCNTDENFKLENKNIPSITILSNKTQEFQYSFQRIFQRIIYVNPFNTTVITSSTIWPSNDLKDTSQFSNYSQCLVNKEILKTFLIDNFQLKFIKQKTLITYNSVQLIKLTFQNICFYIFSSGVSSIVEFSLFDFLCHFLSNFKILKLKKNHELIEDLSFLFELVLN